MSTRNVALGIAIFFLAQFSVAQTTPSRMDVENRVNSLLGRMTIEEKIELIGGIHDFYTKPIPRLGIPSLKMSDGPLGVHDYGLTTAYPAGIALAASWDWPKKCCSSSCKRTDRNSASMAFICCP